MFPGTHRQHSHSLPFRHTHWVSPSCLTSAAWQTRRCWCPGSQRRRSWMSLLLCHLLLTSSDEGSLKRPILTWHLLTLRNFHPGEWMSERRFRHIFLLSLILLLAVISNRQIYQTKTPVQNSWNYYFPLRITSSCSSSQSVKLQTPHK